MAKEYATTELRNFCKSVTRAAAVLRRGGVIVFPTETVYGIGVLASSGAGVRKLRKLKQRPDSKPFQFLVPDIEAAEDLGAEFSNRAEFLTRAFWPGPLTLVVPCSTGTGESEDGTIGVRVPDAPFILEVCCQLGGAIMSSSANPAGAPAPNNAEAADVFGNAVDLLVDGGSVYGVASTVVKCSDDKRYEILRSGGISDIAIENVFFKE